MKTEHTPDGAIDWNEEMLRSLVLMPLLHALGVAADSIAVEWNFSVRLGRTEHRVDGRLVRGRADALIRNAAGENLFVVELKAPDHELSTADRDQAISYARLLDQIAPFALVSNGRQTEVFDTINKAELVGSDFPHRSGFFSNGRQLATDDDIRIRFEALEYFIGYSVANVRAFSLAYVADGTRTLRGRDGHRGKYVRELYVPRERIRTAMREFLETDASVFALVGESGVGKTNEMCALAEHFLETHLVLFVPGHALAAPLVDTLAESFNWTFSQHLAPVELFKYLGRVADRSGKPILLFVDALDEASLDGFSASMSAFARHIARYPKRFRLVVSSKRTEWDRFATLAGNPSELLLGTQSTKNERSPDGACWQSGAPVLIDQFGDGELQACLGRYETFFDLNPVNSVAAQQLCHHPFFLRTFSESYQGKKVAPSHLTSDELIRHWLDRKFAFSTDPLGLWTQATKLAAAIHVQLSRPLDRLPPRASREQVSLVDVADLRLDELIQHEVLVRTVDEHGRASVRFYYSEALYFLIARHVLRLDRMGQEAFVALLPSLLESSSLQEVLTWHLRSASIAHRNALKEALEGRALLFVTTYSDLFERLLPTLRSRVTPYTDGAIGLGFVADYPPSVAYGFYPLKPGQARVTQVTFSKGQARDAFDALLPLGCVDARSGGVNFSNHDPRVAAAERAAVTIKELIAKGDLDESVAPMLEMEALLAIVGHADTRRHLGLTPGSARFPNRRTLFPIDLELLRVRIQEYLGISKYRNEWTNEQIQTRSRYFTPVEPGSQGGSIDMSGFNTSETHERVSREVAQGADFANPRYSSDGELLHLLSLAQKLLRNGATRIEEDLFALPDREVLPNLSNPMSAYSDEGAKQLIEGFLRVAFDAYDALVETNFARVNSLFAIYADRPHHIVAHWTRPQQSSDTRWGRFVWGYGQSDSAQFACRILLTNAAPGFEHDVGSASTMRLDGWAMSRIIFSDLSGLFQPRQTFGFGRFRSRSTTAASAAPLRAFVYSRLKEESAKLTGTMLLDRLDA